MHLLLSEEKSFWNENPEARTSTDQIDSVSSEFNPLLENSLKKWTVVFMMDLP
jgi:hypothetical protein